ncbi:MAG: VWA domain-containing protein [bacterium]|nr:VWA domain-containing protein [bacterium]
MYHALSKTMKFPHLTTFALCGAYLALAGCTCGKEQQASERSGSEAPRAAGSSQPPTISALPALQSPDLDAERALELFQSIGTDEPPLEIPPPIEDLSGAIVEVEPNDSKKDATPMGTARLARGTTEKNYDYFQFEVEGTAQRWLIEVRGPSVSRAEYSDSGGNKHRLGTVKGEEGVQVTANLVLQPGAHYLYVYGGEGGDYTIRLFEIGSAAESDDREPNNDATRAAPLRAETSASGILYPTGDIDFYRFSTFAETTVRIHVQTPPDLKISLDLSDAYGTGSTRLVRWYATEPGQDFEDTRLLLPGDYLLALRGSGVSSRSPYSVRYEVLDQTETARRIVDLEPNDDVHGAGRLPNDRVLVGTLAGSDDYYHLPRVAVDTKLVISGPVEDSPTAPIAPTADDAKPDPPSRRVPKDIRLYPQAGEKQNVRPKLSAETGRLEVDLPASSVPILQLRGSGAYHLELDFDPPLEGLKAAEVSSVDIRLSAANRRFAAFIDRFQKTQLQAALANRGERRIDVELAVTSDHYAWVPDLDATSLSLAPGETRVVEGTLEVAPDAWSTQPARLSLEAEIGDESLGRHSVRVFAECGAPPVGSSDKGLLPPALAGGFNAAVQTFGGRVLVEDERARRQVAAINDGFTYIDGGPFFPIKDGIGTLIVELAGSEPVPVAGVLLNPLSKRQGFEWIRDFDLLLSEDGVLFTEAVSGTLARLPIEQAFPLTSPVPARFAQLRVRSTHGKATRATLGELKIVAAPEWDPADGAALNLSDPELGGHIVRWNWLVHYNYVSGMLTEEPDANKVRVDPDLPTEWVVGFHHNRAAQIERLEWVEKKTPLYRAFDRVLVAVSTESPLGPWQAIGSWDLTDDRATPRAWELDQPVWARFVKFSSPDAQKAETWDLPESIRIWERPSSADYRSILTEWGHYSASAFYETTLERPSPVVVGDDDNDTRESADRLPIDQTVGGVVTLGEDEDWYRIEISRDANTLDLEIAGDPRLKAVVEFTDEGGNSLSWDEETVLADSARMSAILGPDRTIYARVFEPPRSIAFAWDNSGSVGPYRNTIYQAMARFSSQVKPRLEFANLHPFGGTLLLDDWSDRSDELQYAAQNYDRRDSSSSAEPALALVSDELAERQGTRAVVFLTDAVSPTSVVNAELWSSLERSKPHVFTLHLHTAGSDAPYNQDRMQDWAVANGGRYEYFRTQGELDAGFQRAACHLRRPARYQITARTRFEEPPGPGFVAVEAPQARADHAVELVLDASGSMLKRIAGKTRIAIARDVLTSLVNETIPEGTPLALRVFGHRKPEACDTELVAPLAPLERDRIVGIVRRTEAKNLAKTPIGASLALVAQDLAGADGPKLVILITDGEETCGGDPAGAIRELKQAGIEARLSVVGFAIDDAALKAEFESWARVGGGLYFDTADENELREALDAAMKPKFQVLDSAGEIVAEGTAGGDPVEVPMGLYRVKVLTSPARVVDDVRVEAEKTVTVMPAQ